MNTLPELGTTVVEEEQVVELLNSLPSSHTTLTTALEPKGAELSSTRNKQENCVTCKQQGFSIASCNREEHKSFGM